MENKVMELLNYLFSRRFIYWRRKKEIKEKKETSTGYWQVILNV